MILGREKLSSMPVGGAAAAGAAAAAPASGTAAPAEEKKGKIILCNITSIVSYCCTICSLVAYLSVIRMTNTYYMS